MSDSAAHGHDEHHGVGHVAPLRYMLGTGIALLFLTWVTVAVARIDLGEANIFIALAVAIMKAGLVMAFFMHLRWDRPFNTLVCIGSIAFVALMISFVMIDSLEYQSDIIQGDAPAVLQKIEEVAAE